MERCELVVLYHDVLGERGVLVRGYSATHGFLSLQSYDLSLRDQRYLYPLALLDVVFAPPTEASRLGGLLQIEGAHVQQALQSDLVRHCIALFMTDVLSQILVNYPPEEAMGGLIHYYVELLSSSTEQVTYLPHRFLLDLSVLLGYTPRGEYTPATPRLHLATGSFLPPPLLESESVLSDEASRACDLLLKRAYTAPYLRTLDQERRNDLLRRLVGYLALHLELPLSTRCIDMLHTMLHQ